MDKEDEMKDHETFRQEMKSQAEAIAMLDPEHLTWLDCKLCQVFGADFRRTLEEWEAQYGVPAGPEDLIYLYGVHTGRDPRDVVAEIKQRGE
jgi:hypothetical protein